MAKDKKEPEAPKEPTAVEAERAEQAKIQAAIDAGEAQRVSLIKKFGPEDADH